MKVVFCTLYLGSAPTEAFQQSLKNTIPLLDKHGFEHTIAIEENCPYISAARAKLIRKALDHNPDVVVFLDYDVSWQPEDMIKLLQTEGDVVAGTYRYKHNEEEYMGMLHVGPQGLPLMREDGCLEAMCVPAGFLKVTVNAINHFAKKYPELMFGSPMNPDLDMFNHGVIDGVWFGEDYAFCKRWLDSGGKIWLIPDLNLDHNSYPACYKGNFHKYLLKHKERQNGI